MTDDKTKRFWELWGMPSEWPTYITHDQFLQMTKEQQEAFIDAFGDGFVKEGDDAAAEAEKVSEKLAGALRLRAGSKSQEAGEQK